jgi:hypothetical protein
MTIRISTALRNALGDAITTLADAPTVDAYNVSGHQHVGIAVVHNPKYRNAY